MLETRGLTAHYGDFQALFGIDLTVRKGETVALLGANGAGKTTLLRSLTGLTAKRGGSISFDGRDIGSTPADEIARLGIAMVPEGRMLFASLNVEENLRMGEVPGRKGRWTLEEVYRLFPILRERRHQPATQLSGGQQQMVSIGRALMMNPDLLLCDEISLGLAPSIIDQIYRALTEVQGEGLSIVLVEQDVVRAKAVSQRLYCLLEGRMTLAGPSGALRLEDISKAYFGS